MLRHLLIVLLLAGALPAAAQQQDAARSERARSWREVERGAFIRGTIGGTAYLGAPTASGGGPVVGGFSMGLGFGLDLLPNLQIEAVLGGALIAAPPDYLGLGDPANNDPHGDFSSLLGGAKLRFAYLRFPDSQGIDRLNLTVHAGAGVLYSEPASVFGSVQLAALGGTGVHYYTRMRHFSVGLEVDAIYGLGLSALALYPHASLAYTF